MDQVDTLHVDRLLRKERRLPEFTCVARTVEGDFRLVRDMSPKVG